MNPDELSWSEVIRVFESIRNDHYQERKEAHHENLKDEEADTGEIRSKYESEYKRLKQRSVLHTTIISAFMPESRIADETGWEYKDTNPLDEVYEATPDILIGNVESGGVIILNCITERDRPHNMILELDDAADIIRSNRHTFSEEVDIDIDDDDITCVLCVPEKSDRRTEEAVRELQDSGNLSERFAIWRVDGPNSERIDFYEDAGLMTDGGVPNLDDLHDILADGVEVASEKHSLPKFYPFSHHEIIAENTVGEIVAKRLTDDAAKTHFSEDEFHSYLSEVFAHSNATEKVDDNLAYLLKKWRAMNLIEELNESETDLEGGERYFRFVVDTKGARNIMNEIADQYKERAINHRIEIKAMRETLKEFDEKQRSLDQFSD